MKIRQKVSFNLKFDNLENKNFKQSSFFKWQLIAEFKCFELVRKNINLKENSRI